jgi:hypothetical protein
MIEDVGLFGRGIGKSTESIWEPSEFSRDTADATNKQQVGNGKQQRKRDVNSEIQGCGCGNGYYQDEPEEKVELSEDLGDNGRECSRWQHVANERAKRKKHDAPTGRRENAEIDHPPTTSNHSLLLVGKGELPNEKRFICMAGMPCR